MRLLKQIICASRGRNPINPSDRSRTGGGVLVQRLELADDELAHTITSVAKDNWLFEIYEKSNSDRQFNKNEE